MKSLLVACLSAASPFSTSAHAQPPLFPTRVAEIVSGTVSSVSKVTITVTTSTGASKTVTMVAAPKFNVSFPIQPDRILAGGYIATTDRPSPGGAEPTREVRIYAPTVDPESYATRTDLAMHLMSIKGAIAAVTSGSDGDVLTVVTGMRQSQLRVPVSASITYIEPGNADTMRLVNVGTNVLIFTSFKNGEPSEQAITVSRSAISPAPRLVERRRRGSGI